MFFEIAKKAGSIEVICGSMFSGKTEELIRRMKRAQFANQKVEIYKPCIDVRYSDDQVVSHDAHSIPSTPIDSPASMLLLSSDVEVVGVDEAQFFDETIVEVVQTLANRGVRVIIAGLDTDYMGKPFGPMPALMAVAEDVQKVHVVGLRIQTRQQQGSNKQKGNANIPFIRQAGNHNKHHHDAKNGSHCNIAEKNTFKQFYLHFGFSRNQSPHLDSPPWITGCLVFSQIGSLLRPLAGVSPAE